MAIASNWPDLLDSRFKLFFDDEYQSLPDMVGTFFKMDPGDQLTERASSAGTFGQMPFFTGSVVYDEAYQGYDTTWTHQQFALGFTVERLLMEFANKGVIDQKPKDLAKSVNYRRQTDAVSIFNDATSVSSTFYSNSENVALCSNSHTTTAPGVSTATGFDNRLDVALNATNLATARNQMIDFRDDRAKKIGVNPDTILYHPNNYQNVFELIRSEGRPDTNNNAANVHKGQYTGIEWNHLSSSASWGLIDSRAMKSWGLLWSDKVKQEFGKVDDFDTLIAKWRAYAIWTYAWLNWRWLLWSAVS